MSAPNQSALLDALRKFGKAQAKRPPGEGWYTLAELATRENVSAPTMHYRIKCARDRGVKIEQAYGTALDAEGRAKRATFYRLGK
jgi:hypothetical protein